MMNVVSLFQDEDYLIATIQIKNNLFVDVKAKASGLVYIMGCEDGRVVFDAEGRTFDTNVDTVRILDYFERWLENIELRSSREQKEAFAFG